MRGVHFRGSRTVGRGALCHARLSPHHKARRAAETMASKSIRLGCVFGEYVEALHDAHKVTRGFRARLRRDFTGSGCALRCRRKSRLEPSEIQHDLLGDGGIALAEFDQRIGEKTPSAATPLGYGVD